ncbi:2-Hydroxyacid oxidase 1-like [Haemaphysalis longicornis]
MMVSMFSSTPLEEVVAAASPGAVVWAQMGIREDRSLSVQDALHAKRCGCAAIVFTVDLAPMPSSPFFSAIGGSSEQIGKHYGSLRGPTPGHRWDFHRSWDDVDLLRRATDLPVILKGILRADDAIEALKHGVSGIIVSNHGGRYMDEVAATV